MRTVSSYWTMHCFEGLQGPTFLPWSLQNKSTAAKWMAGSKIDVMGPRAQRNERGESMATTSICIASQPQTQPVYLRCSYAFSYPSLGVLVNGPIASFEVGEKESKEAWSSHMHGLLTFAAWVGEQFEYRKVEKIVLFDYTFEVVCGNTHEQQSWLGLLTW